MKKYKAVIIDDEPKLREVLGIKVKRFCPNVQLSGEANDAMSGYQLIKESNPDIIFLDISMPGESGFDLLDRFEEITFEIIFVTGFNDYALDALKLSAVDYLLKPVRTEDLKEAVDKAIKHIDNKEKLERFDILKHNLNNVGDQSTKIAIPGADAYDFVSIKDIIRCEGWQKYTKIFLQNKKCITSSYNIGIFKESLEKFGFFSTHKSHLINKHHIHKYLKEGTLIMSDQSNVPVSRRKKEAFLNEIISGVDKNR
jgi:two-component system LytT family response regulator